MDRQGLIELYKEILHDVDEANKLPNVDKYWNKRYTKLKGDVETKRQELDKGGMLKADDKDDFQLLERLLFMPDNGIANAGLGRIKTKAEFEDLIGIGEDKSKNDDNILDSMKAVILKPNFFYSKKLFDNVKGVSTRKGHRDKNRNVIVNRVVAACTEDVSSTVDNEMFDKVFSTLFGAGKMIDNRSKRFTDAKLDILKWYDRNIFLLKEVREILKEEMGEEPDLTYSSMLIWHAYEKITNSRDMEKTPSLA